MKSIKYCLVAILAVLSCGFAKADGGYNIKVHIEGLADSTVYFCYYYGDKQYAKDTLKLDKKANGVFKGDKKLDGGIYFVLVPGNYPLELMIDKEQNFSVSTKFTGDANDLIKYMTTEGSDEVKMYVDYQQFMIKQNSIAAELRKRSPKANAAEKKVITDSLALLYEEVKARWDDIETNHHNSLLAAVLRINKDIEIPDFPRDANGKVLDSAFQYKFYKKHFFDNVDFQDARMLRTQFFQKKIDRYFEKMILQAPDTIIKESKMLLDKAEGCDDVFRFLLQTIFNKYNNSDIMGMDKVLVFFGDNYYLNGRATWADSTWLEKLRERVEELRYNQVGNQAVELKLYTYDDQPVTISGVNAEYTVLFFFEPSCGHCKKATPKMKALADKFWERGVEVMGIYTQTDKKEWGDFIEKQGLENWINAWDPYNQSGFRLFYDIRSTPSIYLLDRGKKIIAKRIDVETLEKVLEDEYARKGKK
jgi:peroxiredoxin